MVTSHTPVLHPHKHQTYHSVPCSHAKTHSHPYRMAWSFHAVFWFIHPPLLKSLLFITYISVSYFHHSCKHPPMPYIFRTSHKPFLSVMSYAFPRSMKATKQETSFYPSLTTFQPTFAIQNFDSYILLFYLAILFITYIFISYFYHSH